MKTRALILAILLLPAPALADVQAFRGRLAEDPANMVACRRFDEQIQRGHTVTLSDGRAEYTAPGGIRFRLDPLSAGVFGGTEELAGERLLYTFTLATKVLAVRGNNLGCKWSGTLQ